MADVNYAYALSALVGVCAILGGFLAFRSGRAANLTNIQQQTITALQMQINSLKDKIGELEKENILQRDTMDKITSALKQKGLIVTIDGDMVVISSKGGAEISATRARQIINPELPAAKRHAPKNAPNSSKTSS